ncbi:membrane dipeptidase [Prolixibacteraceae bacterium Z1-6]|uniref:Membrane dipeptidase n=1 Tax=Draconibacterium aestuarii TaxID=2998507 RepID=A0A9X3J539_9BACT|nr:membrane dipeptidase [Prolixibacteraceae bacterium Z1-6]
MKTKFIDLHVHPAMKPLGKSFNSNPGLNHPKKNRTNSIWFQDPPTLSDKIFNILLSLTKFRQSDFTSLAKGGAHIVFVSLCGLEKGFVMKKDKTGLLRDLPANFVAGIGKKRIDYIQKMTDYFTDLQQEYDFYNQLNGTVFRIKKQNYRYKIISSFNEIKEETDKRLKTIYVILTIEGTHVFNAGLKLMDKNVDAAEVMANIDNVKRWKHRLFFIGLTHHFDNEMVGHAPSLSGIVTKLCDQTTGMYRKGFTKLGKKVLKKLLDNSNGQRVLIDMKHLSTEARKELYSILDTEYANETIPLIVSHAAVNGWPALPDGLEKREPGEGLFQQKEINFYDDELVRIAKSGGLFGIQFDERRLGSDKEIKKSRGSWSRRKMLFKQSKLVWNQIQHIAEVLNSNGEYAWGIQCIGSDYDGIVNSLNGFWTAEEMPLFDSYLEKHAYNYLKSSEAKKLSAQNKVEAGELIEHFMHKNAYTFLEKNF